jgi:GMP synthase-like glutamine amidotransferase
MGESTRTGLLAIINSMTVFAFRHVPFEGLGLIEPVMSGRGIEVQCFDLHGAGSTVPDARQADGLIFMGGPMSVNDDLPYLRREEDLIREAAGRGIPVLGVCLGAQLIAKALGARVYRNSVKEIGWFPVEFTEAATSDPLLRGLPRRETVFHWHGETFDLPAGAERLAWSEACARQAFRAGTNIYGLQFHLEVTPAMIRDWCEQDGNCGDMRELEAPIDPCLHRDRMQELSKIVFGRWCDLLGVGEKYRRSPDGEADSVKGALPYSGRRGLFPSE